MSLRQLYFTILAVVSALHSLYTAVLIYALLFGGQWDVLWQYNNYGEGPPELLAFIVIAILTPFALRYLWRTTQ